ncbi:alpha/beta fold hydrolase [Chengkuizengella axinellae]|uniref:Alpha/beta hydrolase n=1 Tax=Chengkuizengella axinellae TaxID=3064388 RepID=A0ABT9J5W4_9BACL|nr:alpha/beta hydrolase [Chengkuizengella sp. 2205SS18-9]MDP5277012.1 alpha/beta hydrolase [Chengkuizengella sp. 2205SS18-9]
MKKIKPQLFSIPLNGLNQYYSIQTDDEFKPLLLYLHGGPGGANLAISSILDLKSKLTKHFSVVQYDQRGAGKSYNTSLSAEDLSIDYIVDDIKKLIAYLIEKHNQVKVYLVGQSFGTLLGLRLCREIPQFIYAYLSISQLIHLKESEMYCTQEALKIVEETRKPRVKTMLTQSLSLFEDEQYAEYIKLQRSALAKLGGFTFKRRPFNPNMLFIFSALSPLYSIKDAFNMKNGMLFSTDTLWNDIMKMNLFDESCHYEIPLYFITGLKDIIAPLHLVEKYLNSVTAPKKKLITFEKSGHLPHVEEKDLYEEKVIELFIHH